jgi:hypothetical protein
MVTISPPDTGRHISKRITHNIHTCENLRKVGKFFIAQGIRELEVQHHPFLISLVARGEWPVSRPGRSTSWGKFPMEEGARCAPESSLNVSGKKERSHMQILFMNQFIFEIFALLGC